MRFSNKDPRGILPLGIDYADLLDEGETIVSASAEIALLSGTDADPAAMLLGSAVVDGSVVGQWVQGGVAGCTYRLTFIADTSATKRLVEAGDLLVVAAGDA